MFAEDYIQRYMTYLAAALYWGLALCWSAIIVFYFRQYLRFKKSFPLIAVLLTVLFVDGVRTLIESIYFGTWYTARTGLISQSLYRILAEPGYIIIPKTINLMAALLIILFLVRKWFGALEDERRRRNAADRLRADLVSFASHELRTPLTSIYGYADTLLREYGKLGADTDKEFLTAIASESQRLDGLITELLDMSQAEDGHLSVDPQPLDPAQIIEVSVSRVNHPQVNHTLQTDIPASLPKIWADPDRVQQILINLLSNAIKYSPNGTKVLVTARQVDGSVEFSVTDQGVGIAPEEQAKIFARFHRVPSNGKQKVKGTGLGLYITKSMVEAQGGRIGVKSQPGHGSTFHFTMPLVEAVRK